MLPLVKMLISAGLQYAVADLLMKGNWQHRRRYVIRGLLLWAVAALVLLLATTFLLLSLFFMLADIAEYIRPAVITGLITLAAAVLLGTEGWRQFRRR